MANPGRGQPAQGLVMAELIHGPEEDRAKTSMVKQAASRETTRKASCRDSEFLGSCLAQG